MGVGEGVVGLWIANWGFRSADWGGMDWRGWVWSGWAVTSRWVRGQGAVQDDGGERRRRGRDVASLAGDRHASLGRGGDVGKKTYAWIGQ